MGAISSMINSLDNSTSVANEQRDLIAALQSLADAKAAQFTDQINTDLLRAGTAPDQTIAIDAVLNSSVTTRCTSAVGPNNSIVDSVQSAVNDFIQGGGKLITAGICTLLSTALGAILGEGTGDETQVSKYYVAMNGVSLLRVDVRAWSYQITSSALKSQFQYSMAAAYYLSSVNIEKLHFSSFLALYQEQCGAATPAPDPAALETEIDQLHQLYNKLRENNTSMLSAPLTSA